MKRLVLIALVLGGCKTRGAAQPTPTPTPAAAANLTTAGILGAVSDSGLFDPGEHEAAHRAECPPAEADDVEHCVWLKPMPGITGIELERRLKAAGYGVEAEGDKVTAYWKPSQIEAFFGVKPGYIKTGGSTGGMVCMMILPKGARPATKGIIEGWAIDDPVCEM